MDRRQRSVLWFNEIGLKDVPLVGGKNAALGEMFSHLSRLRIEVPNGFAITSAAYRRFISYAGLKDGIAAALKGLDTGNMKDLHACGEHVRKLILEAKLPPDLIKEITAAYKKLGKLYFNNPDVAVRSSATAEDLPGASFAGQQETYLDVRGGANVVKATKKAIASLFTDRAISYRKDKGFSHFDIALSVGVQKMVRSDLGASGVMFTIDTESGFPNAIVINSSYGLGEMVVQGKVTPDEFVVFKPTLEKGFKPIIGKTLGVKDKKMVYGKSGPAIVPVPASDRAIFSLTDAEALKLARWGASIEKYFSKKHGTVQPMDIEWAKDGKTGKLFIVQARPETVHSTENKNVVREYTLKKKGPLLTKGVAVGSKIASGKVRVIHDAKHIGEFKEGEVLVTEITDPDWEPIMKIASAIVTDKGGRTSHAAIVSRELGIPAVVGCGNATHKLKTGTAVTIECASGDTGFIYKGLLPYRVAERRLDRIPETKTKVMVNIGSPDEAFKIHYLPVKGVGLGRLEFIINSHIRIHPNALLNFAKLKKSKDADQRRIASQIERLTQGWPNKKKYYTDKLTEGIAKIAATFWPHDVIIRFSDFKTNEYRTLIGGTLYEPVEENPMIGWRGASRYYDPKFKSAFGLECAAMKQAREKFGLTNIVPMVPFCRTVEEGKQVLDVIQAHGLDRKKDKSLRIYVMCEIPSNVILADEFMNIFDGMSIVSNDLTQLVLGLDRDSGIVSHVGNENNPAVTHMIAEVVKKARARRKYIGICGQAPSDYPSFAQLLVEHGIESISLNPDSVLRTIIAIAHTERNVQRSKRRK